MTPNNGDRFFALLHRKTGLSATVPDRFIKISERFHCLLAMTANPQQILLEPASTHKSNMLDLGFQCGDRIQCVRRISDASIYKLL